MFCGNYIKRVCIALPALLIFLSGCSKEKEPETIQVAEPPVTTEQPAKENNQEEETTETEDTSSEPEKEDEFSDESPVTLYYDTAKCLFTNDNGDLFSIVAQDPLNVYFEQYIVAGTVNDYVIFNPRYFGEEGDINLSEVEGYTAYPLSFYALTYDIDLTELINAIKDNLFYSKYAHIITNPEISGENAPITTYIPNITPIMSAAEEVLAQYFPLYHVSAYKVLVDEVEEDGESIKITCYAERGTSAEFEAIGVILNNVSIGEENGETTFVYESGKAEFVKNFAEYSNGKENNETTNIITFK